MTLSLEQQKLIEHLFVINTYWDTLTIAAEKNRFPESLGELTLDEIKQAGLDFGKKMDRLIGQEIYVRGSLTEGE